MYDVLSGRFTKKSKTDLKRFIKWNTVVRQVRYNKATDNFTVTAEDLKARHTYDDTFTHVIVATGIFNVPNKPTFPGIRPEIFQVGLLLLYTRYIALYCTVCFL
jgi:trimethylamine monooxygenase